MSDPAADRRARRGALLRPRDLAGVRVLVTAGGTREPIDTVRYLGNRSSGKMGFAVARRGGAARRGGGAGERARPRSRRRAGVRRVDVGSALEMRDAVLREFANADVVMKAAAVADFRPASVSGAQDPQGGSAPKARGSRSSSCATRTSSPSCAATRARA